MKKLIFLIPMFLIVLIFNLKAQKSINVFGYPQLTGVTRNNAGFLPGGALRLGAGYYKNHWYYSAGLKYNLMGFSSTTVLSYGDSEGDRLNVNEFQHRICLPVDFRYFISGYINKGFYMEGGLGLDYLFRKVQKFEDFQPYVENAGNIDSPFYLNVKLGIGYQKNLSENKDLFLGLTGFRDVLGSSYTRFFGCQLTFGLIFNVNQNEGS